MEAEHAGCWFPVHSSELMHGAPYRVPWSFVSPFEARAQANHDQTLSRLAERGGLDLWELFALVHDLDVLPVQEIAAGPLVAWLNRELAQHSMLRSARAEIGRLTEGLREISRIAGPQSAALRFRMVVIEKVNELIG